MHAEAWEFVESKKHTPRTKTSGATDANILRAREFPPRVSACPIAPATSLSAKRLL